MKETKENQLVRSEQIEWKPLPEPGIEKIFVKSLQFDEETQRSPTILLKFEPGARYPLHDHPEGEEIFVLEGDIHIGKDHLFAGDYLFTAPDKLHAVRTDNGCVLFLKATQGTVLIEKR